MSNDEEAKIRHLGKRNTKSGPDKLDKKIGANVRSARILCGFSQEKLANGLNITFQQVQKYENGTNRVSAGSLYRISQILNTPLEQLYDGPLIMDSSTEERFELNAKDLHFIRVLKDPENQLFYSGLRNIAKLYEQRR